ncbi:Fusaric acid resistance protein-like [Streptomyces sp. OV198]|nr:Fusaric acid resistance protein-like [Streptomyces sp. OV198]
MTADLLKAAPVKTLNYAVTVGLASLLSYWLTTTIMSSVHLSHEDGQLGGMCAVIATIFVLRTSRQKSLHAAFARMSATLVSFALCLAYLAIWPFHPWGLALLVAISVLIPGLIGQPDAEVTAAITTTVIMVVAGLSPQEAWKEPILRLADTIIGVAAGIAAAILLNEIGRGRRRGRSSQHDGPQADPPG